VRELSGIPSSIPEHNIQPSVEKRSTELLKSGEMAYLICPAQPAKVVHYRAFDIHRDGLSSGRVGELGINNDPVCNSLSEPHVLQPKLVCRRERNENTLWRDIP